MDRLSDERFRKVPRNHRHTHINLGHDLLHMKLLAGFPF
jgi:hypothetical protein